MFSFAPQVGTDVLAENAVAVIRHDLILIDAVLHRPDLTTELVDFIAHCYVRMVKPDE